MKLVIDCSPEQIDVIGEHLLEGKELGLLPDERQWMLAQARKQYRTAKILSAGLDLENARWVLELEI